MKTKIWALIALIVSLSSCTGDDTLSGGSPVGTMRGLLQLSTVNTEESSRIDTRAVATSPYPTTGTIGFYVKADAAHQYIARTNLEGKYDAIRKLWLPKDSIWLNESDAEILVYAPYDAAMPDDGVVTLTAREYPEDGSVEKEYMYKRFKANCYANTLAVTLGYAYARFDFTVTRDASYPTEAILNGYTLKGKQIHSSAQFSAMSDSYVYGGTDGLPIAADKFPIKLNADNLSVVFKYLVVPVTLTDNLMVDITMGTETMRATLPISKFTDSKLEAGKQYNVHIKMVPDKLIVTSVTLTDWSDEKISGDKETGFQ